MHHSTVPSEELLPGNHTHCLLHLLLPKQLSFTEENRRSLQLRLRGCYPGAFGSDTVKGLKQLPMPGTRHCT